MSRRTSLWRWLLPAIVVLAWLALSAPLGSFSGNLGDVQTNDSAAFLPDSAESTRVSELQREFDTERSLPVILLWESEDGPLGDDAVTEIGSRIAEAVATADEAGALNGDASPPIPRFRRSYRESVGFARFEFLLDG